MKINIAIPSHNRVDMLKEKTLKLLEWLWEITIFANPKGEADKYRKEFPDIRIVEIEEFSWMGKLRADILSHYQEWDYILMVDDDIWELKQLTTGKCKLRTLDKQAVYQFIYQAFDALQEKGKKLWGVCPTDNPFYMSDKVCNNKFIIWCFMGLIKTDLEFDPEIYWKEDYDFTMQNILCFGWVDRYDYITTDNKYWTTKGGLQDTSRANIAQRDIQVLKSKYGSMIKDNPLDVKRYWW